MKLKSVLIVSFTTLIVFLIYLNSKDTKVYYLSIGDYLVNDNQKGYAQLIKDDLRKKRKLETYISGFSHDESRITDIINQIQTNQTTFVNGKDITIKNALIKADFVLLSAGSNDLFYKLEHEPSLNEELYNRVDQIIEDGENLYQLIRKYCKEDIFVTGFYNPYSSDYDELIHYANERLKKVLKDNDMTYVEVNNCIHKTPERLEERLTDVENECVYYHIEKKLQKELFDD